MPKPAPQIHRQPGTERVNRQRIQLRAPPGPPQHRLRLPSTNTERSDARHSVHGPIAFGGVPSIRVRGTLTSAPIDSKHWYGEHCAYRQAGKMRTQQQAGHGMAPNIEPTRPALMTTPMPVARTRAGNVMAPVA